MDEREKAELNKQKKIVDCIEHLNTALEAFDRLKEYKSKVLPIIDGLDMNHSDTYFEVTEKLKRELFFIKSFSSHAAEELVKYRRLINPDRQIYSVKEKKRKAKYGIEPIGDTKKFAEKTRSRLKDNQTKLEELLQKQKLRKNQETNLDLEGLPEKLEITNNQRRDWQIRRANKISKIELNILKLKWAIFMLFVLQAAILIKLCF